MQLKIKANPSSIYRFKTSIIYQYYLTGILWNSLWHHDAFRVGEIISVCDNVVQLKNYNKKKKEKWKIKRNKYGERNEKPAHIWCNLCVVQLRNKQKLKSWSNWIIMNSLDVSLCLWNLIDFFSFKYDYPFPYYVQLASYAQNKIFQSIIIIHFVFFFFFFKYLWVNFNRLE